MGHSWGLIGALAGCFARWGGGDLCALVLSFCPRGGGLSHFMLERKLGQGNDTVSLAKRRAYAFSSSHFHIGIYKMDDHKKVIHFKSFWVTP